MRWWWQSAVPASELVRELRAIAGAGFGEVEIAFSPGFWADAPQREALRAVLGEAERLGVGVAMTLGAAWPLQTPNTTTGSDHAAQELQYGTRRMAGTGRRVVELPRAFDDPDGARPARLVAVTAARVLEWGPGPTIEPTEGPMGRRDVIHPPARPTTLDSASLVDLTPHVVADGVTWEPRQGDWALFAFWVRDSEQGVTSFLDGRAARAATAYLDEHQIGDENGALITRVGTELFEDSLELNADSLFWAPDLVTRFAEHHGYDPTPYLAVLFAHGMCRYWVPNDEPVPDFELDTAAGGRIRRDYYRLLTDLYVTDHLLLLQEWSVGHGVRHKAQVAYGQNLEPVRSNREFVRAGGRAEGESLNSGDRAPVDRTDPTWRFALDWQRSVVGGAHQGGAVRISTELGAQFQAAYTFSLGDYRQMLDKEWAAGITKPFVHGFASQAADSEWPTQSRFQDLAADSWNDTHFPEWPNWPPLTDYWARGTAILETGAARTDIAIYRDGFLTTAARGVFDTSADATAPRFLADTDALERAGFSVQFLDPIGLAEDGVIGADGTLFPDGPAYRGLVVAQRAVSPEAAEAIDAAAERGLRVVVVGQPPEADSGFAHGAAGDARVRAAIGRALSRPTVTRLASMAETARAFRELGLVPRVAWEGAGLLSQWREAGSTRYVLVYNTEPDPVSVRVSLEGAGRVRELDLSAGQVRAVDHAAGRDRTGLTLDLAALGLRVFEFELGLGPGTLPEPTAKPSAPRLVELAIEDWSLEVVSEEPGGPRTLLLAGTGPGDWREIGPLSGVSGTGRYTARVAVPETMSAPARAVIDLGDLAGSAVVRIGGREFGPAYVSGTVLDLGDALTRSRDLTIEVRTPLRNAVIAAGTRPHVTPTTRPHGLGGPVRIFGSSASGES